jgi:lipopolysaccharide export system protein LptA
MIRITARGGVFTLAMMWTVCALAQGQSRSSPLLPGATGGGPIDITSGALDFFDKDQKLVYGGGVTVKQGGATLKASSITIFLASDALRAAPGSEGGGASASQIRRLEAAGPVSIVSQDQVGTGDRMFYDRAEYKVHLIGGATLSKGPSVQKCDEFVYDLTTSVARGVGSCRGLFTPGQTGLEDVAPGKTRSAPQRPAR